MKNSKSGFIILFIVCVTLFSLGYAYLLRVKPPVVVHEKVEIISETANNADEEEFISIKVYFPDRHALVVEQRQIARVFSQKKILKATIQEFLLGRDSAGAPVIPMDTVLLSVYIGSDGIAYINFSEDFRRNFHGDAVDEYLLLKGLYESTISNIKIDDVRLLIEGKEVDSIGGHFVIDLPLKHLVTQESKFGK